LLAASKSWMPTCVGMTGVNGRPRVGRSGRWYHSCPSRDVARLTLTALAVDASTIFTHGGAAPAAGQRRVKTGGFADIAGASNINVKRAN